MATHDDYLGLQSRVAYLESKHPGVIVISGMLYRRRQLLEGSDGKIYVMTDDITWDSFPSLETALDAINAHPNKYVITGTVR